MEDFEDIYLSLLGHLGPGDAVPWVENAFAPESPCEREYCRMREAYERLCRRLGVGQTGEDPDLEIMVDALEAIQRQLCESLLRSLQTQLPSS